LETAKISVIIPVYNAKKYLRTCLDSVLAAMDDYGKTELVLVDNGSTDGSYEILNSEYAARARIYQLKGVTISALRNHGARVTQGDYLSFIDSDCVIPRDYFLRAVKVLTAVNAAATGWYYSLPVPPGWIEEAWFGISINWRPVNTFVPYLYSGNLFIKRSAFDAVGGFNESLVTGEDAEIGLRLNAAGSKIYASPEVPAVHLGNPKTLVEFFKKHTWHALGMFGTFKFALLSKPVWMTLAHLLLTTGGVVNLFRGPTRIWSRVATSAGCFLAVPMITVAYRSVQRGSVYRPLRSTLLYFLYYSARIYALILIGLGRLGRTAAQPKYDSLRR